MIICLYSIIQLSTSNATQASLQMSYNLLKKLAAVYALKPVENLSTYNMHCMYDT